MDIEFCAEDPEGGDWIVVAHVSGVEAVPRTGEWITFRPNNILANNRFQSSGGYNVAIPFNGNVATLKVEKVHHAIMSPGLFTRVFVNVGQWDNA